MPITSLAAGQMKMALIRCDYALAEFYEEQSAWPLMTIHDAGMWEVDESREEDAMALTEWGFDGCMDDMETGERMFRTPITSDAECVTRWVK